MDHFAQPIARYMIGMLQNCLNYIVIDETA